MSDLIDKVKELLKNELNLEAIADDARQEDYPEWDSLTYLRVLAALEETFQIRVTPENINRFNSVANIVDEIEKQNAR